MKLNGTGVIWLILVTGTIAGCHQQGNTPLKRKGSPSEMVAQFTNLLATGNIPERMGALDALGTLARESWDLKSKQTAIEAMLRATQSPDTNVQKVARFNLSNQASSIFWSAAISNAATPQLTNSDARIRSAAAGLLLRQDNHNAAAASVLLSLLKHPEPALREVAFRALTFDLTGNPELKEQLQTELGVLWKSGDLEIRLDSLSLYWELRQSKFSRTRVEAELSLLELLQSKSAPIRRRAANILLKEQTRISELATLPLQDFIEGGLTNSDPYIAATMAHVMNETVFESERRDPTAGSLETLQRGMLHPDPEVRLAALSPMAATHRTWWRISNSTNSTPRERTAAHPLILRSLTNALHDPNSDVRLAAVEVLRYLPDWTEPSFPSLWEVKIAGITSTDAVERQRWLRRATTLPNAPQKFIDLFKMTLKDPDWHVRLSAVEPVWIWGAGDFCADYQLWLPLCNDPVPTVRFVAGNLLAREAARQGRGTNAPWETFPAEMLRLVDDPYPNTSLVGLIALRQLAAATNESRAVLEARHRLDEIAAGSDSDLQVRLAAAYARTYNWPKSPDTERHLRILAGAPDAVVRRQAVSVIRYLKLTLPEKIQEDRNAEVRFAATNVVQSKFAPSPLAPASLDVLLEKMKENDPVARREAAIALAQNQEARKKIGVVAEAVKILLETYTNAQRTEFPSINGALINLSFGNNSASLQSQVHAFAVQAVLKDEPAVRRGTWGLFASALYHNPWFPVDEILSAVEIGLRRAKDRDVSVRLSAVRVLTTLEQQLIRKPGETNAIAAEQIRTLLVDTLKDPEPEIAIAAASAFISPRDGSGQLGRILANAELSSRAASILQERATDPQPEVQQVMSSVLALAGAQRSETNWVEKALTSWEGLFTRSGRSHEFYASSSTAISGVDIPVGAETLRGIAFSAANSWIRKRAIQTLALLLDAIASDLRPGSPSALTIALGTPITSRAFSVDELEPVRQALVKITRSGNKALADEAGRCLSSIPTRDETLSGDLLRRAHSAIVSDRRSAMLELANPSRMSTERFHKEARRLANDLTGDSNEFVRAAALEAFVSNMFPTYNLERVEIASIDPLAKALDDSVPEIQLYAFRSLSGVFQRLEAAERQQLALPLLRSMMTLTFINGERFSDSVADFARLVEGHAMQNRLLLDAQERINKADSDSTRSQWVAVKGRLYLGFNQPDQAVEYFRKCMSLDPNRDDAVRRDLEKALLSAGRYNELAFEPAPRPNGFEYRARFQALAKEGNVAHLVLSANRALDGFLSVYGNGAQVRGVGEPDFVIREAARLLQSMGKLDILEEFLKGAIKRYPESPEVPVAQANLFLASGRKEEAILALEGELKLHFWNDSALNMLGTLCRESGQLERYEKLLLGLVEKNPEHFSLCRPMVEIFLRTGKTNEARRVIDRFDSEARVGFRNQGAADFAANPDFSLRYAAHQMAMSQLLELCGDLDGAIAAQIKCNNATSYPPHLSSGQQRLEELEKRAGRSRVAQPEK